MKLVLAGFILAASCASAQAVTFTGKATVQDGDTIYVDHQAIRLFGVDAEELSEPHGVRAKYAMRALINGATLTCVADGASYSRVVARCYFANGVELNQSIISSGWALDCKHYSGGIYRQYEAPGARARLIQKPYCK